MRLFGYYALHSVFNQIRKLFKTWVLVLILVCALFGGLILAFGGAAFITGNNGRFALLIGRLVGRRDRRLFGFLIVLIGAVLLGAAGGDRRGAHHSRQRQNQ